MPVHTYEKLRLLLRVEGVSKETEDLIVFMFEQHDALFERTVARLTEIAKGKEATP